MKSIAAALVLVLAAPFALALVREDPRPVAPASKTAKVAPTYDVDAVGSEQIATALARAKRNDKRVLLQWGANWCGWCIKLSDTMKSDKDLARELMYEYEVVKIDIGQWNKHLDLVEKYGATLKAGVPYLTILDADGKPLANTETGNLEEKATERHDPAKIIALLKKHETPRVEAAKLRDAALARAKAEGKRVFLHFGAPWCVWCHRLEDWMARPEIAAVLGKEFVDLKIDTDRNTGGQEMLVATRGPKEGGIPWFAFLDAEGHTLVTSDGPAGNTGFPAAAAEIAHFRAMLEKVATKITKAEIDAIAASLVPPKKGE